MKIVKYIFMMIILLLVVVHLTRKLYFYHTPVNYTGNQIVQGLIDSTIVYTDGYGFPHIYTKNTDDLFFISGYLTARERLFQLSLTASIIRGNISSFIGDKYDKHDEYLNRNDLFSLQENDIANVDDENLRLIQTYCDGINTYIDELGETLPVSFKVAKSKPIKWTVDDVIKVPSLMNNYIVRQHREAVLYYTIKKYFGDSRYLELAQLTVDSTLKENSLSIDDLQFKDEILELIGANGSLIGSSLITLNESPTDTAKPILVFQDIWGLTQPTKWFDMHLKGGDYNIEGAFIPGFPLPMVGRSESSLWSYSNNFSIDKINQVFDVSIDTLERVIGSDINLNQLNSISNVVVENVSVNDVIELLGNNTNENKAKSAKLIANIYLNYSSANRNTVNSLLEWNGKESSSSSETLLINVIYKKLIENIFKDELELIGDDIYYTFLKLPEFAEKSMLNILNNPESNWLDDIRTPNQKESLSDIVIKSIDDAIEKIHTKHGVSNWQWGNVSTREYKHTVGNNRKFLNLVNRLNIGPFPAEGSTSNININEFDYSQNFNQITGVAIRRIFDLSDMSTSYSILPTGQSGLPNSPHYSDQVELFTNHQFRKIELNEENIRNNSKYQKLTLIPSK